MSKYLVIVESPTKVKTISKFLSNDYKVEACSGHIRDLPKSKMGVDVDNGFKPEYITISKKKKILSLLKKEAKGKEIIYLACDPDREGEAIAWHIKEAIKTDAKIYRATFNEITKEVVIGALKHPLEIDINKVNAQQARRILDRIVGYGISPLLWKKVVRGLSAGRVQSVAVLIIAEREKEIKSFVSNEYWELEAELQKKESDNSKFTAKLNKIKDKKPEVKTKAESDDICLRLKEEKFIISDIENKEQKRYPKPPFITSTLQEAAFNKLRFTASKTMRIAQQLYEGIDIENKGNIGLITYMRTDSFNVSDVAQKEARNFIESKFGKDYLPDKVKRYKNRKSAQGAHEAVRPTSVTYTPESLKESLDKEQYNLYQLIWERFLASCMKEAIISLMTISIKADDCLFKASGSKVLFNGFMIISGKEMEEKTLPSQLIKGEELDLLKLIPSQHFTKPPARYTDASLIRTLEEKGIGRPSTYAPTIRTIIYRHYIKREDRSLAPTELGMVVNDLLVKNFPDILDIKFTARMEEKLDKIEKGELKWQDVMDDFYKPFVKNLEEAKVKMRDVKKEVVRTDEVCEKCGKPMVIKWSRYGKFLSCSDFPQCKNAKSIDIGIKCPSDNCDGMLVQRRSKYGRMFYGCSKYPECKFITNKLPKNDS